MTGKKAVIIL